MIKSVGGLVLHTRVSWQEAVEPSARSAFKQLQCTWCNLRVLQRTCHSQTTQSDDNYGCCIKNYVESWMLSRECTRKQCFNCSQRRFQRNRPSYQLNHCDWEVSQKISCCGKKNSSKVSLNNLYLPRIDIISKRCTFFLLNLRNGWLIIIRVPTRIYRVNEMHTSLDFDAIKTHCPTPPNSIDTH